MRAVCGICGSSTDPDAGAVRAMLSCLEHRGPDDEGVYSDPGSGVSLGARRLAIIDVDGGHQPVSNEDGTIWAVLNGEIYNHPDLMARIEAGGHRLASRTDTEVLVHLYEDFGEAMVHGLEGMYAFAIWDTQNRKLLLARDRFGEKPLFYTQCNGRVTFASELSAVEKGSRRSHRIVPGAVDAFFVHGYVPGPASMLDGVEQLPAGSLARWSPGGRLEVERYWEPQLAAGPASEDGRELVAETSRLLRLGVRSRMIADVPLGVFLSGGVDSSLIASFAAEESSHAVRSFSVGYDVGNVNEVSQARAMADHLGLDHHELRLDSADVAARVPALMSRLDQPIADPAIVAMHAVSEFARSEVTVVIGGEGADELFGGYPRYRWLSRAGHLETLPHAFRRGSATVLRRGSGRAAIVAGLLEDKDLSLRHLDWVTGGRREVRPTLYGPRLLHAAQPGDIEDSLLRALRPRMGRSVAESFMRLDQRHWLPDDVLAKADRAGMLVSLEIRTPFLERRLAEFANSVRPELHLRKGGKWLLRRVLAERVPARFVRKKTAFRVPADEWLAGPLAEALRSHVSRGTLVDDGWFNKAALTSLVDAHTSGWGRHASVLWPLLTLGIWLDARQ